MQISDKLLELIVDLHDGEDFQVRVDYSGRGMFGRECLGIVGKGIGDIIHKITNSIIDTYFDEKDTQLELFHELTEMLSSGSRQDSMGLNTIIYFPDVEIDEEKKKKMSKNNKMSKKDRIFAELIDSLFSEDEIKKFAKKLKEDCQEIDTKEAKETLNKVINDVNKAEKIKSYLCLINFGEETLFSLDGYFNDIINSIRTVCSNIREDEKEKKILWRNIAKTILEVLGEEDE